VARRNRNSTNPIAIAAATLGAGALVYGTVRLMTRPRPRSRIRYRTEIDARPDKVLDVFSDPIRLASMMKHADIDADSGRLTWHEFGPMGFERKWDPQVETDRKRGLVRWWTDDDASVKAHGVVQVRKGSNGKTELRFNSTYVAPAPIWPRFLADRTRSRIEGDLDRVCEQIENPPELTQR